MKNRVLRKIFVVLFFCSLAGQVDAQTRWVRLVAGGLVNEGRVSAIAADTYVIDIGISRGARVGDYYLVHYDGGGAYDANGVLLGIYKAPVAVLKVSSVATSESFCEVAAPSKGWVIQQGDRVVSISRLDADNLRFATFRQTPGKPRLPGYLGRWVRTSVGNNWALPGLQQGMPSAAPGFYYMETPMPPQAPALTQVPAQPQPPMTRVQIQPVPTQSYQSPIPTVPPMYQPFSPSTPAFDVNQISDARLIRTFPLTQVEMYALEIQHRGAWNLYANKRYREAFSAFCKQSLDYAGNYLSAYWAGTSALKLNYPQAAVSWFNRALEINPYYQPAIKALSDIFSRITSAK
ncbi:MAG: hypothetical protein LBI74_06710 [Synergistaceae bacterium]|nr:hypothetical protein [Synergistaceae bacterium]